MPLPNYSPCMDATDTSNTDELIQNYFTLTILPSLSTLKRRLQDLQLRRRSSSHVHVVSADELKLAIQEELVGSGDGPGWWRNFFKDLRDFDLLNDSDPVQVECLRFCFMSILRKELHKVAESWNQHIISRSKFGNSSGPRGRPDCMHFLPNLYDVEDCKVDIDLDEIEEFYDDAAMNVRDYSEEFEEFALTVMNRRALSAPIDVKQAFNLYIEFLREIELAS
eukprot:gene13298-14671_t